MIKKFDDFHLNNTSTIKLPLKHIVAVGEVA